MKRSILSAAALGLIAASSGFAATIASVKTQSSGTAATIDSAVVSFILDAGSTFNNSTVLLSDSTGNIEAYRIPTATYAAPAVGDSITITGGYNPYNGLAELTSTGTPFAVTVNSQNNATPAPKSYTIADLQNGSANSEAYESTVGTLSGVHFTGVAAGTNFAAATSYTVTDSTGTLTATVRTQSSGVSSQASLIGTPVPTGDVSIFGVFTQFSSTDPTAGYQFNPITVTATPEPASIGLLAIGGLLGLRRRRA